MLHSLMGGGVSSSVRMGPRSVCTLHPRGAVRQRPHYGAHYPAVRPAREIHQGMRPAAPPEGGFSLNIDL